MADDELRVDVNVDVAPFLAAWAAVRDALDAGWRGYTWAAYRGAEARTAYRAKTRRRRRRG